MKKPVPDGSCLAKRGRVSGSSISMSISLETPAGQASDDDSSALVIPVRDASVLARLLRGEPAETLPIGWMKSKSRKLARMVAAGDPVHGRSGSTRRWQIVLTLRRSRRRCSRQLRWSDCTSNSRTRPPIRRLPLMPSPRRLLGWWTATVAERSPARLPERKMGGAVRCRCRVQVRTGPATSGTSSTGDGTGCERTRPA